jgi:hypothetical protein
MHITKRNKTKHSLTGLGREIDIALIVKPYACRVLGNGIRVYGDDTKNGRIFLDITEDEARMIATVYNNT